MTYNYEFATGTQTIEIDEKWASVLAELDSQENRNNHTETRRHESYTNGNDDSEWLAIEDHHLNAFIEGLSFKESMLQKLPQALEMMKPLQRRIIILYYFEHKNQTEIAVIMGITQGAVSQKLATAKKNLKKILQKT